MQEPVSQYFVNEIFEGKHTSIITSSSNVYKSEEGKYCFKLKVKVQDSYHINIEYDGCYKRIKLSMMDVHCDWFISFCEFNNFKQSVFYRQVFPKYLTWHALRDPEIKSWNDAIDAGKRLLGKF